MKLYLGTYRADKALMDRCLVSLTRHVDGWDEIVFVDDSGDYAFRKWLERYGQVHWVGSENRGFAAALRAATDLMKVYEQPAVCWWEEDFTAVQPIYLNAWAANLTHKLCQVTFQRQPWFPVEHELGLVGALEQRTGRIVTEGPSDTGIPLLWHQAQFSTNPGVWGPQAWRWAWPNCAGSEDEKTRYLVDHDDQWFAITPDVLVHHDGERNGQGY